MKLFRRPGPKIRPKNSFEIPKQTKLTPHSTGLVNYQTNLKTLPIFKQMIFQTDYFRTINFTTNHFRINEFRTGC